MIEVEMPPAYTRYFTELEDKLNQLYEVAGKARARGLDATLEPEPEVTTDIAERIEKLIGPKGITQRMRELEGMDRREMSFKIAQEIALGRYGSMEKIWLSLKRFQAGCTAPMFIWKPSTATSPKITSRPIVKVISIRPRFIHRSRI